MCSARIVEFAGLPGAGKTTIARAALAELETLGIRCFSNESLVRRNAVRQKSTRLSGKVGTLGQLVLGGVRYKRVTVNLLRCIAHTRSLSPASLTRAANLLVLLNGIRSVPADRYDLILLDQGLVQYIWSIFVAGDLPPERDLHRLLTTIFKEIPLAVIFVQIDVDDAVSRIRQRKTQSSRFDDFSPPQAREYLSKYRSVFDNIRCWSFGPAGTGSLDIDGSRPISHNVRRIIPFIAGLLPDGRTAGVNP
jgi:thymidylate kinase